MERDRERGRSPLLGQTQDYFAKESGLKLMANRVQASAKKATEKRGVFRSQTVNEIWERKFRFFNFLELA